MSGKLSGLGVLTVTAFACAPEAAQAQFLFGSSASERPRVSRAVRFDRKQPDRGADRNAASTKVASAAKTAAAPTKSLAPLMAVVSIGSQRVTIYDGNGAVMHAPVSTGQAGHRTPMGIFSVIQKDRYHESNIYSGAPMPYMQRITWSGIAMHAGPLPGYPASHGCIRMPDGFASKLFGMTRMGMRVVVSPHDVAPVAFSHPALPTPLMTPVPTSNQQASIRQGALPAAVVTPIRVAQAGDPGRDMAPGLAPAPDATETRLLNPQQRAQVSKIRARADAVAAVKTAREALENAQRTSAEANTAVAELRAAEASHQAALVHQATHRSLLEVATTEEARRQAAQNVADAEARVADMVRLLTEARAAEAVWTPDAFAAAVASREADDAIIATERASKAADRAVEPVSVFVSRKEGKLLVRQGFTPVFEAPVTFTGDAPLGTHLYVAMAADEASGKLRWTSVSVPNSSAANADRAPVKRGQAAPADSIGRASTAADVWSRVEIAPDVMEKIADRIWLGGSIIISDLGISTETGQGTDFVVLTR